MKTKLPQKGISFGQLIRKRRKKRRLSLKEVAIDLNIAPSALSRIENDICLPSATTLIAISNYYNISLEELKWIYLHTRQTKNTNT